MSAVTKIDGRVHWIHKPGDKYQVTGVCCKGTRVSSTHSTWLMASCINLWKGSKWLVRGSRKYLIQRVNNS